MHMHLKHVKYDLSHGFPQEWPTSRLEREIVKNICNKESFDLVVNATWGFLECEHPETGVISNKFEITKDLVKNYGVSNMLFYNFVDPMYEMSTWYDVLQECKEQIGEESIKVVGFIDSAKFKQDMPIQFWAIYNSVAFTDYSQQDLLPKKFDNLFICYNRKPTFHRKWLHEQFVKHDLLTKGIFTLGNEDPAKVVLVNKDQTTLPFENNNIHGNLNIPNDTLSVGPLDAWNSSFLVIVTETDHNRNTVVPFLSEKIWKPLIGMRPFVVLGDNGTTKLLRDNGFHTFNQFFGVNKDDLTVNDIVHIVKTFDKDLEQSFNTLKDKLIQNRKRFFEFADEQKTICSIDSNNWYING